MLAASAAFVSATAGCTGLLDDDDDERDEDLASDAPADATLLAHLDVAAVAADDAADVLADFGVADPDRVADATASFEARTGLDPLEASEVLLFGEADLDDADSDTWARLDVVVESDWSEADVVSSLEEATDLEYESTTYADESVLYEPTEEADDDAEPPSLGDLGGGRFVVGDGAGVRDSLDVRYGDADSVSGLIRDAYDDARGAQLTVASEVSGLSVPAVFEAFVDLDLDILDEVEAVGRSYAAVDDGIALEVDLHVDDDRDAEALETTLRGALPYLGSFDEEFDEIRDDIVLGRDGTVVTAAYEGESDAVFSVLDLLDGV